MYTPDLLSSENALIIRGYYSITWSLNEPRSIGTMFLLSACITLSHWLDKLTLNPRAFLPSQHLRMKSLPGSVKEIGGIWKLNMKDCPNFLRNITSIFRRTNFPRGGSYIGNPQVFVERLQSYSGKCLDLRDKTIKFINWSWNGIYGADKLFQEFL